MIQINVIKTNTKSEKKNTYERQGVHVLNTYRIIIKCMRTFFSALYFPHFLCAPYFSLEISFRQVSVLPSFSAS